MEFQSYNSSITKMIGNWWVFRSF